MGSGMYMKPVSEAVPPDEVRFKAPEVPFPTTADMVVEERILNDATLVPPSVIEVVPVRLLPVMVIAAPEPALVGVNDVIQGISLRNVLSLEEHPSALVTVTL